MTKDEEKAQTLIELAEAEFSVIKQERVLQYLLEAREPTDEARTLLERLRKVATTLSTKPASPRIEDAA